MGDLTDTQVHKIQDFIKNNSCLLNSDIIQEHTKLLSILPTQFEQMLKNQEIIINKQDDIITRLIVLETEKKTVESRIVKLEDNQVELFKSVAENKNQIDNIYSARRVYLWVVNGIWALLVGLILYLFDKGK